MQAAARYLAKVGLVTVLYFVAAKLGLRLATVTSSVSLVWPPTGVAIAALLLLGRRVWPGVALGALAANFSTPGVGASVALGIATGNTFEALLAVTLLERARFEPSMRRIRDVVKLFVLAAAVSTLVSASIGSASLLLGGLLRSGSFVTAWVAWWIGDMMGAVVFAPLLLTLASLPRPSAKVARIAELVLWAAGLVAVTLSAFGLQRWVEGFDFPQAFAVFPLVVGAALRFGPPGAAGANFIVSLISVWATANGLGPFAKATLGESLLQLQSFMAMVALTSLVLGASVAERDHAITLRDDFLSIASHELRSPLTAIHLDVSLLARLIDRGDPPLEKLRSRIQHTGGQVERLSTLIRQLLDSSQIAAGRLALELSLVDLSAIARDVVVRLEPQVTGRGAIQLEVPGPVRGRWDPMRLELVVTNLVSNAIKYGSDNPITVTVSGSDHDATLTVQDRGIGIPARDHGRVFGRFERAVSANHYAGFGLGLWISRTIVEAMHGRIQLESEVGAGSTFKVTLPRGA